MSKLEVEVWSDVACPWCWVGKRRLDEAIAEVGADVDVVWRAFELDPSAPRSPSSDVDYVQRLANKYRVPRAQAQAMIDRMTQTGREAGIAFRFDRAQPGNTFDAHRLLHWARAHGKQHAVKERLFSAHFHEGRRVSDRDVLADIAGEVGLDPEAARAMLQGDTFAAEVRADEALAARLGIHAVPFFVIGGRFALRGAQPRDVVAQALRQALEASGAEAQTGDPTAACGPDGCDFEVPGT